MVRSLVVLAIVAATGSVAAAPFVARDQRHFEHDRHTAAVASAGRPAAACSTCHDSTPAGDPALHGKAEHNRCFGACHDHTYGITCGAVSKGGASGPTKQVCLVCHATLLSTCNPPGLVPQAQTPSFVARFAHAAAGHDTPALDGACALCHRTEAGPSSATPAAHAACNACHTTTAKPEMTACAGCHVATPARPARAADPFRVDGFDHAAHSAASHGATCFGCHPKASGEALRPTMTSCRTGCHDGTHAFTTTGTSCTKCHRAADPPPAARADLGFSHALHERRSVRIADCASCHALETDGTLATPLHGKDHQPCATSGCHDTEFATRAPKICGICHATAAPWTKAVARPGGPESHEWFEDLDHASHLRTAGTTNSTCEGCHVGGGAAPRGHRACASCHGSRARPAMTECAACHARTAPGHAAVSAWSVATTFKHATHAADPRTARPTPCVECHATIAGAKNLASVAAPTMQRCDGCHDGKLAFKSTGFGCARCHARGAGS